MTHRDERLEDLADRVSGAGSSDWPAAERDAPDDDEREIVRRLAMLDRIAAAHRQPGVPAAPGSTPESAPPQGRWNGLHLIRLLGSGAYGDVFLAWDETLQRQVALKLLAPDRRRPRRAGGTAILSEARRLARFRHLNVVAVHGAAHHDGRTGIWMEFVRGHTLREVLREQGRLGAREAALIGMDLCRALSALHRHRMTHGDIKAENVMREEGGRIVLMDFGSGREYGDPAAASDDSPTTATPLYVAPEVFEGTSPNPSSDLYSVGVLLHHLVTGGFPIEAGSVAELRAAHARELYRSLRGERSDLPEAFVRAVERAMARDPSARFRDAAEMEAALAATLGIARDETATVVGRGRANSWSLAGATALGVGLAALAFVRTNVPRDLAQLSITPPAGTTWAASNSIALAPDGEAVAVFATDAGGQGRLWLRRVDASAAVPLPYTEDASYPFWAPDGHSLAFFVDGSLKTMSVPNGPVRAICPAKGGAGGSWAPDGSILFAPSSGSPIYRVPATGGTPVAATRLDAARGETDHLWPQFLPDGRRFIYLVRGRADVQGIHLASLDGRPPRLLVRTAFRGVVAPPGYLFYEREGRLFARKLNVRKGALEGPEITIATSIATHPVTAYGAFDASRQGTLVLRHSEDRDRVFRWVDRSGELLGLPVDANGLINAQLSPDGRRLVGERMEPTLGTSDLWIMDLPDDEALRRRAADGPLEGHAARFTFHPADDIHPQWSPDGRHIVFASSRNGAYNLFVKAVSGSAPETLLFASRDGAWPDDWIDGAGTILYESEREGAFDFRLARAGGSSSTLLRTPWRKSWAQVSPDGRWLAYASRESGELEIYVQSFPALEGKWQISRSGGAQPLWRQDGRELFFLADDGTLMAATVEPSDGTFLYRPPRALFKLISSGLLSARTHYAPCADGSRFIVASRGESGSPALSIVLGWPAWIGRRS